MAVQSRLDQSNFSIFLSGNTLSLDNETFLTDAGRTVDLVRGTIVAQVAATQKWVPLTNIAATTGEAIARGIYVGDDIPFADLVAGDVTGRLVVQGGAAATFDKSLVVFENSLTQDSVVGAATLAAHTVGDDLAAAGIFLEDTIDIDELEN